MLKLQHVLIGSDQPERLAAFYRQVFNADPVMEGDGFSTFLAGNGAVTVGPHSEVHGENRDPGRILMGLETDDVPAEFERIKGLGATVIAEPYKPGGEEDAMWLATFADPDGNYFQIATPWQE